MANFKRKSTEEKREKIDNLIEKMDKSVESYFINPDEMKEYLKFMGRMHNYSLRNTVLIKEQFGGANAVGSFKFWKDQGYSVNKGEKGLSILVPIKKDASFKDEEGKWKPLKLATDEQKQKLKDKELTSIKEQLRFKEGYVFDIKQTNAPASDLPKIFPNRWIDGKLENYEGINNALNKVAQNIGVKIVPMNGELGSAKGAFFPLRNEIEMNPRNSEIQETVTLIHELAHAKMHTMDKFYNTTAAQKEFQAEMVSYVVSSHFGIANEKKEEQSLKYLVNWTKGKDIGDKKKLLEEVRETSLNFIDTIEKELTKEKQEEKTNDITVDITFSESNEIKEGNYLLSKIDKVIEDTKKPNIGYYKTYFDLKDSDDTIYSGKMCVGDGMFNNLSEYILANVEQAHESGHMDTETKNYIQDRVHKHSSMTNKTKPSPFLENEVQIM